MLLHFFALTLYAENICFFLFRTIIIQAHVREQWGWVWLLNSKIFVC